jgi:hypothetical protein
VAVGTGDHQGRGGVRRGAPKHKKICPVYLSSFKREHISYLPGSTSAVDNWPPVHELYS